MQLRINTFRFSRILGSIFSLTALVYSGNAFAQTSSQHLRFETEQGIRFHVAFSSIDMLPSVDLMVYMTENMQFNKLDSLVIKSSHIDAIGYVHIRYYHFHAHHKVVGSEVVAHYFNNKLASINGVIYKPVDSEIEWSKTKARNTALEHSAALSFKWHDPQEEIVLKLWKNDSNATYFPEGTLVYCAQNFDFKLAPVLCYVFEINADSPLIRKDIYINAVNGEVWAEEDLLHIADVQGSANTKYRGVKPITTDSTGPTSYRLRETGRGNGIETYDMKKGSNYSAAVDFTDSDNYWNNYNTNLDETATDAHYGAEMTYDYFKNTFNRNSFDDKGAKIRSYVHYGSNYSNAFWNGSVMTYGDGNGSSVLPLTSLDVCGHEVSHAVTTNTAGLIYSYESGALNESFSDIFGNAIEFYADSTQFNWRIGEDIITSGNGIRNMANPNTHGDPDTYKGTYWRTGSGDNGGVHTNSGVQNFWFYLLTEGGSGTNDNGSTYSVDSLGIHKAGQIAYRNLTTYLTRSSNYAEARYYAIQSAVDLYGSCSKEVIATTNAWYAVGVGSEYDSSSVQANFVADTLYCFTNQLVQFFNKSVNANSYLWSFGDGNTSTAPNPSHTYASTGPHSVKLVVNGCFFGSKDTMLKAKYIQYDSLRDICSGILLPFGTWNTVHACNGFIYDNGGELDYEAVKRDTLTVDFAGSDSCVLVFQEFDYEDGYDSIYVYDGYNTSGKLIGGYTGQNLPKGGNPILFTSGAITITHFSDPYVEGSGFKAKFTSYRPTLQLSLSPDTTVCYKSLVTVKAVGSGGSKQDYSYVWNGSKGDSSISFVATRDTVIYLIFADECMKNFLYDSIKITVLDSLKLLPMNDVTLCYLEDVILVASATGGMQSDYTFTWLPFNTSINPWQTNFASDTTIFVTIQDGCTQQTDTISFRFFVRDSLTYTQSSDTLLCQGTTTTLTLTPKGGLGDFVYTSSTGTSAGPSQSFTMSVAPVGSGKHFYWIAFSDGCTNTNDTAFYTIELRDSLSIALNKDTTICYGTFVDLITTTNGGKLGNHIYVWSYATPSNSKQTVQPLKSQSFEVTLRDGCSAFEPKASIYVEVLDSLKVIILAQDTSCYGEIVNFAVDVTGGKTTSYTYNWNLGAGKLETFTKKIQTEEIVQLAVSDGCTPKPGDDSHLIRVRDPLKIIFPEDDSICYGQSFDIKPTFSGGIPSAYKVLWNEGLGSGVSKLVNPLQTTLFIGTLTDNCSTPNQDNFTLVVNSLPIVNFSINPSPYCTDRLVNFTSSVGSVGVKSLNWDFGDGSSSALPNPSHGYADPGFYTIKLEVEDVLGCRDSLIQMDYLEIVPHPRASFIFDPINADYINPFFTFQNLSDDANIFMWDFGDGTQSADVNTEHEYADTGFYAVMLIAGNEYGCPDTLVLSVRVDEVFILFYPNAFTPDNDGLNDGFGVVSRGLIEYRLVVYTRWGEILFETTDQLEKWDGKKKGVRVQSGVYPFRITGTDINGNAVLIDETVLLLY